jgi:hypothetical protein
LREVPSDDVFEEPTSEERFRNAAHPRRVLGEVPPHLQPPESVEEIDEVALVEENLVSPVPPEV